MRMSGARLLIEGLKRHGATTVFGIPGGRVLPIYDELHRQRRHIRHVLTAHEQGAAHAADGFARAGGGMGVCLATSGPGATNLVTGIATAYADSSPVVFLTGNVPTEMIGTDAFQEADITGMTMPITKNNWMVKRPEDLRPILWEAFRLARSGRPGPVLIDIPEDIQTARVEAELPAPLVPDIVPVPSEEILSRACDMIAEATRPLIMIGGGAARSGAREAIALLSDRIDAPMVCSLMGLTAAPDSPRTLGFVGLHGRREANQALADCDLLIALGTRLSDRFSSGVEGLETRRVIHVDIDRAEIGKRVSPNCYIVGDVRETVTALLSRLSSGSGRIPYYSRFSEEDSTLPARLMRALANAVGPEALVATDVGQHQMWVAQHYRFSPQSALITSGGMGTMGFGLGAAVGAALARPARRVVLVTGDGSLRMSLGELITAASLGLNLTVVLLDNGILGMIRQLQAVFYQGRYSNIGMAATPDWTAIARGFGFHAARAESPEELSQIISDRGSQRGPLFIQCPIPGDEMVRPMIRSVGHPDSLLLP